MFTDAALHRISPRTSRPRPRQRHSDGRGRLPRTAAIILLTDATLRHRIRIRWRQKLPMYELMRSSIIERPESCMLTPASACFVNIHNGNCYDVDASWYRNAVSRQH